MKNLKSSTCQIHLHVHVSYGLHATFIKQPSLNSIKPQTFSASEPRTSRPSRRTKTELCNWLGKIQSAFEKSLSEASPSQMYLNGKVEKKV